MLKLILVGIWVILVTAGATFASVYISPSDQSESTDLEDHDLETLASELASIPIIRGGDVVGYVILQLSFGADKAALESRKLDPMPYIKDSAFRVVFTSSDIDFRRLKAGDLDALTDRIAREANMRLGADVVRHVLFQQLNYVKKEDIRTNWISGEHGSEK